MRSDDELTAELRHLCETSITRDGAPVLVEFSAAWCSDCRRLGEMKQAKALAAELAEWPNLTVNVGRFDHHRPILDAMQIQSIAHWAILRPANCQDPIDQWTRIADRTLEVSSGEARKLTPADLAQWLRLFRRS
jgi:thiol-disulfide isomerase/thioredoxin